jgi:ABC-2 type transport system permease protein
MTEFLAVFRHEVRRLVRDRALQVALVLMTALLAYAVREGREYARQQDAAVAARRAEESQRLAGLQKKATDIAEGRAPVPGGHGGDPRKPANVGGRLGKHWAVLPPVPVASALATGQSDLFPVAVAVTTRGKDTLEGATETANPAHLAVGRFDPAFVLVYLFPLFVIALAYNLLSEEREAGTLDLILSQPVAPSAVFGAKVAARAVLLVAPVATLAFALPLLGGVFAGERVTADVLIRLLLSSAATLLYGLFWLLLCALVNTGRMSSPGNASALVGLWAAVTLVLPSALSEVAARLYPAPPRSLLIEKSRAASAAESERGSRLLARYYEDHPELARSANATPVDPKDFAARRAVVAEAVEAAVAPVLAEYERQLFRQQAWADRARYFAPPVALLTALSDAAGTGTARRRAFAIQTDRFHDEWKAWFLPKITARLEMTEADWPRLPRFTFREEDAGTVAGRAAGSLVGLAAACLALEVACRARARRLGVR